jgi:hypothetical protein
VLVFLSVLVGALKNIGKKKAAARYGPITQARLALAASKRKPTRPR